MNERTGKLLVLGGAGIHLLNSGVRFLLALFKIFAGPISTLLSIAGLLGAVAIAGGFALIFLAERNILDLIIAGGFAVGVINNILNLRSYSSPELMARPAIASTLLSLVVIAAYVVWAFKLYRNSNAIAALAVVASFGLNFIVAILSAYLPAVFGNLIISSMISIASNGALVFAAFLDLQGN